MPSAPIFWFTGLSGSGKSTVTNYVHKHLTDKGIKVRILDGDDVRDGRAKKLGFSPEDIETNNKLISELCLKERQLYDIILVPVISPIEKVRQLVRAQLGPNFFLIYCNADLESVVQRDVKGLYEKAKQGVIPDMIGFSPSSPYEIPKDADLILNTGGYIDDEATTFQKAIAFVNAKIK